MSPSRTQPTIFNVGDRVTLNIPLGSCRAGDEGVVTHVGQDGLVVVRITHIKRPNCVPHVESLPPQPGSAFTAGGECGA